ncbi:aminodeoxychorismate/anthranilate synthase component II [Lysinibacter sp. HNR]|uniref:anthranilate synthase component II n=1 Tax=Lysinibacter sp. HNR TaxID=3031408 RepID=UPI002434F3F8|nr:aminodeoxychorismate/anthranilate synthase component II [Lysinibacter sp. HNR]WGD37488.1 aminodeoxychorismate/anthranilate synthase component II [Lysinibacter sp. HNR]
MSNKISARVLIVDNFDSYTWNIFQGVAQLTQVLPEVLLNNSLTGALNNLERYTHIILGPGPGDPRTPTDVGAGYALLEKARVPLLGVCLGHQMLAVHYGATLQHLEQPAHGRVSTIRHNGTGLFQNLPPHTSVVRYHSITVSDLGRSGLSPDAHTVDGDEIMGISDAAKRRYGVQFHPESILTSDGQRMLTNFLMLQ